MDQHEDPAELEREIERAKRLASSVTDRTTSQRLWGFVEELRQKRNGTLLQGGLSKKSERGPTNFGSNTANAGFDISMTDPDCAALHPGYDR